MLTTVSIDESKSRLPLDEAAQHQLQRTAAPPLLYGARLARNRARVQASLAKSAAPLTIAVETVEKV